MDPFSRWPRNESSFQTEAPANWLVLGNFSQVGQTQPKHPTKVMSFDKSDIIKKHQQDAKDTGSPEVQVAILSGRINHLTDHLRTHRKDFHSRRGLIMLTNRRRKLLAYLKSSDLDRYNALISKLSLRK